MVVNIDGKKMAKKIKCWICNSNKVSKINLVCDLKVKHLLCEQCYFIFKNTTITQEKKIKYYSELSLNKLKLRYLANEVFDTARFINYINEIIKKNLNSTNKINHLDIGGGYGFFSKVLQDKFDNVTSYNLEPDKNAGLVVKKYQKNVKLLNLRFEDIHLVKNVKFDLVTYWGGVYRTIEPNKVFKNLKNICNKKCQFFFSLPFCFEDMRIQHLKLKNSFDDYLLKDDANISLMGRKHMKIFLTKNKYSYKETLIQNKPFKKKIPIFHFSIKKKSQKIDINRQNLKNYFLKNICVYNNHFERQIKNLLNNEKRINKVLIFGDDFLSNYAYRFLKIKKQKNLSQIKYNLNELHMDKNKLKLILNLSRMRSNIFIILSEKDKEKIKYSLINRLHLNINNKIFCLNENFKFNKHIFSYKNKNFLKKKFDFQRL
tara:strand:- start:1078 stop:2367 length:1290 start_codon:yes stop_codon:yes gene_type:complete